MMREREKIVRYHEELGEKFLNEYRNILYKITNREPYLMKEFLWLLNPISDSMKSDYMESDYMESDYMESDYMESDYMGLERSISFMDRLRVVQAIWKNLGISLEDIEGDFSNEVKCDKISNELKRKVAE